MTTTQPKSREGQTGTCRKCRLAVTFLGDIWTVTEGEQYGEINCMADLSAAYVPHEPAVVPACSRRNDEAQGCAHWESGSPAYSGHCSHTSCPNYMEACPLHQTPKVTVK